MDIKDRLNGFITIDEIESPNFSLKHATTYMRQYSRNFERTHAYVLERYKNKWGIDWMGHCSRLFEYPYVASRVSGKNVLDAGSGVSFFPWYLSENGHRIWCADKDPTAIETINVITNKNYRNVVPVLTDISDYSTTILSPDFFDTVYCISVLEHLPIQKIKDTLRVLRRTLKKGGSFIVTFDVGLNNDAPLPINKVRKVIHCIYESGFHAHQIPEWGSGTIISKDLYTTEWIRKKGWSHSLPWKPLWVHPAKSILQGYIPKSLRRNLAWYCGHFVKQ